MTSVGNWTAHADRFTTAVLCGVEALSAQPWAVGAISLCAGHFARRGRGAGGPDKNGGADIGSAW